MITSEGASPNLKELTAKYAHNSWMSSKSSKENSTSMVIPGPNSVAPLFRFDLDLKMVTMAYWFDHDGTPKPPGKMQIR
jgi:hypothetical protein